MVALAMTLIAATLGFGAFSSLMFAWQWVVGPPTQFVASMLFAGVVAVATAFVAVVVRRTERAPTPFHLSWMLLLTAVLFALYWMVWHAKIFPDGFTDAWAIWNNHARFFYRDAGTAWLRMFAPERTWFHPDYPFLLPGLISGLWTLLGAEDGNVPAVVACGASLLSIGVVSVATSALSNDHRGAYGGLILTATPAFLLRSASQYADLPIGLYMLTTVVLLAFAAAWSQVRTILLIAAGLSAGMAAWTKNEGLLFVCVVFVVHAALVARRPGTARGRDLGAFLVGLTPMLALVLTYKWLLAPVGDVARVSSSTGQVLEPGRYMQVGTTFFAYARGFGASWSRYAHPFLMLAAVIALYPLHWRRALARDNISRVLLVFTPVLMLAGYFAVYVITPFDLTWHMATSLERLYLQVWPMSVFLVASLQCLGGQQASVGESRPVHVPCRSASAILLPERHSHPLMRSRRCPGIRAPHPRSPAARVAWESRGAAADTTPPAAPVEVGPA